MGIADGDRYDSKAHALGIEHQRFGLAAGAKARQWHGGFHRVGVEQPRALNPAAGGDGQFTADVVAFLAEKEHETAEAVAGDLGSSAVGVVEPHAVIGLSGGLADENPVGANALMAVAKRADGWDGKFDGAVDQDKIVAEAVVFGKRQGHLLGK